MRDFFNAVGILCLMLVTLVAGFVAGVKSCSQSPFESPPAPIVADDPITIESARRCEACPLYDDSAPFHGARLRQPTGAPHRPNPCPGR